MIGIFQPLPIFKPSSSSIVIGTSVLSGATAGSVLFAGVGGVIQQDNANFFWDDTNNRLGIGIAAPGYALHLISGGPVSSRVGLVGGNDTTNLTNKSFMIGLQNFASTSNPVALINSSSINGTNYMLIGGGSSIMTAASVIQVYTGTTNSTVVGTQCWQWNQAGAVAHTPSTMVDGTSAYSMTATMPTTITANLRAMNLQVTGAGSSAFAQTAFGVTLNAGYTGTAGNVAISAVNLSAPAGTVGLYAGLVAPTSLVSSAALFDNGTTTSNILTCRDNGTAVFTVADGGAVTATVSIGVTGGFQANQFGTVTGLAFLRGSTADGATAIGIKIGNASALNTAGSKIMAWYSDSATTERAYISGVGGAGFLGNVVLGSLTAAGGTSALGCLVLSNAATAPTTFVDSAQLYSVDISAGNATLAIATETQAAADAALVSTHSLQMYVNIGGTMTLKKFMLA